MGAGVALVVVGLFLPWAESDGLRQSVLDDGIPWLVLPAGVADSWLLVALASWMLWALVTTVGSGGGRGVATVMVVTGVAVMGFCVVEGLAIDDELDKTGARVGAGLAVTYVGGAVAAIGGALLRTRR
ncbi:hypothetical protein [Candidatus Poriferisocius sp.]|uniref:hypothetical protein n=1 Tax=Candidatus Poriferisocius sp. TaxID=3101276 RepID=UPI003B597D72